MARSIAPPLAALLLVMSAACQAADGSAATPSPSTGASSSAMATGTGGESGGVPPGFPLPDGATAEAPGDLDIASWTTDANGADIYRFFAEALPAAGFSITRLVPGGAAAVIVFGTPDGRTLHLSLTATADGTRIDLRDGEPST